LLEDFRAFDTGSLGHQVLKSEGILIIDGMINILLQ